jgi:hypothetical protein
MMGRILLVSVLAVSLVGVAQAGLYTQTIDFTSSSNPYWSGYWDSHTYGKYIYQKSGTDFQYQHDLSSILAASDTINTASLSLYFVDDEGDSSSSRREDLSISLDSGAWQSLGEVDTGTKSFDVLALVADRVLTVALNFTTSSQDIYLTTSTLSGTYTPYEDPGPVVPVPAAFVIGLLGLGTAGLKLRRFA